jgi:YHS domain-containing protein
MFRVIFEFLMTLVVIFFVRAVLRTIFKGFGEVMRPTAGAADQQSNAPSVPLTGELKKDPSCGTYISAATSIKEKVGGETFHFCSKECRDKYVASLARR